MHEVETKLHNVVKNILIETYTPACVVIDEKGYIVYIYDRRSKFLEFAINENRLNFMDMIQSKLKLEIQKAILDSVAFQKEIILSKLQLAEKDELKYVNVRVKPIIEDTERQLTLIIIDEIILDEQLSSTNKKSLSTHKIDKKISQLEDELIYTKKNLQATIQELEISNKELKRCNDELQFTNEELQSINEELQSTNEELQSTNEEVTTVNTELENCIERLANDNDDIKNLLNNAEIAAILLDKNLCIKWFTTKSTEIINLIPTDVGRPISHMVFNLDYDKLIEDARTVLQTSKAITTDGVDKNDNWYIIRILPYSTVTNLKDGLILTFLNVYERKNAVLKLKTLAKKLAVVNIE